MNALQTTKLIVEEWMVDSRTKWRSAGLVAGCSMLVFCLAGGFSAAGQEPDAPGQGTQTNNPAAEVLARLGQMVQPTDSAQPEESAAPDDLTATNGQAQNGSLLSSSNRFANPDWAQSEDRRARRKSLRSRSGQPGTSGAGDSSRGGEGSPADAASGTNRLDYSNFKIVVDRNIFDPNRFARRGGGPRPAPKSVDSLTLVGTMIYDKGTYAFFDGTSSDYKKALKLNDVVAGHKVTNITPNSVTLAAGTNRLELKVGMQLRREEDGPWALGEQPATYASAPGSTSTSTSALATTGSDAAASGAESDIIKKLMQRRSSE